MNKLPSLPPIVESILDLTKKKKKHIVQIVEEFKKAQVISSYEILHAPIHISLNYRKEDNTTPSYFHSNSSLLKIFLFYARMQQDSKASSFAAIETANETLSLQEFLYFCKDFKIIPRLLSMAEVTLVWRNKLNALLRDANKRQHYSQLHFNDFIDLIIRIALTVFHREKVKGFIYFEKGSIPTNEDMIAAIATFLYLHDEDHVVHHINTQGRLTQGMLNFRSKGETNETIQNEIKQRKLEAKIRKSILSESSSVASLKSTKIEFKNQKFSNKLKVEIENSLLPSILKDSLFSEKEISMYTRDSKARLSHLSQTKNPDTLETSSLCGSIDSQVSSMDSLSNISEILGTSDSIDNILNDYYNEGLVKLLHKYTHQGKETAEIDGHEMAVIGSSSLDLGIVSFRTKVKISIIVKSLSADKLSTIVTCRDFPANTKVSMHSEIDTKNRKSKGGTIPGFNRYVTIDFVVDSNSSTLCYIDIVTNPTYRGPGHNYRSTNKVSIPVLYRVQFTS